MTRKRSLLYDIRRRAEDTTIIDVEIDANGALLMMQFKNDRDYLLGTIDSLAVNIRNIRDMLPADVNDCKDSMTPFMIGVLEGLLSTIEDDPYPEPVEKPDSDSYSFFSGPEWNLKHPFTCGECSWGRDGDYHNYEEYRIHIATKHKPQGSYCDDADDCNAQACPEHPRHDYDTGEHTWEQHHSKSDHFPEDKTDDCKCDAYEGWSEESCCDVYTIDTIEKAIKTLNPWVGPRGYEVSGGYIKVKDVEEILAHIKKEVLS